MELDKTFLEIAEIVRSSADTWNCWAQILALLEVEEPAPSSIEIEADVAKIASQLLRILKEAPPPSDLSFLYFGLFERPVVGAGNGRLGFYLAGGTGNPEEDLNEGVLSYFPENRFLESSLLLAVSLAAQAEQKRHIFDYLLAFGAAALIAKFSSGARGISLPVFVGFDSGDYAQVAN